ncbi:anti-lipopolysaccharide factor-like [Acropora muricata]|uniref:anti-lipopolysaccharide factor-like n=2 Tax=Acropora TaxID=6127 RepID=UPI0010FCA316|nr:anti-lipopolysaccharide factor-like [Acropora millepora]XP_029213678.1 anti-lipopolysaccharide factor-like [Acropora millepora]
MNIIQDLATLYSALLLISGESGEMNYQGRMIKYKAEGRVHKFKWVYDGRAWDVASGISVKAKHYQSKHGAIEHAVKKLIDKLKAQGIVN